MTRRENEKIITDKKMSLQNEINPSKKIRYDKKNKNKCFITKNDKI